MKKCFSVRIVYIQVEPSENQIIKILENACGDI